MNENILFANPLTIDLVGWDSGIFSADGTVGYFGEASATELISGDDLASMLNITAGTSLNSNAGWIRVKCDADILYIAKSSFRYNLSMSPSTIGLMDGSRSATIGGHDFKLRYLSKDSTFSGFAYSTDPPDDFGSEWNRIMYRLVTFPGTPTSAEGIQFGEIAQYGQAEINVAGPTNGHGIRTAIMYSSSTGYAMYRAGVDVRGHSFNSLSGAPNERGWRPVLELIK